MKRGPTFAQNTPEWVAWRLDGIGASDAKYLVSGSFKSLGLYKVKIGELPESALTDGFQNEWMERGVELEPMARAAYEGKVGDWVEPCLVVHEGYEYLRASLDGLSSDEKIPLEIKCPGKIKHMKALSGQMPAEYYPQAQHILMVTGCELLHYWSFDPDEGGALVEVAADLDYQMKLLEREIRFWDCVRTKTAPQQGEVLRAPSKRKAAQAVCDKED